MIYLLWYSQNSFLLWIKMESNSKFSPLRDTFPISYYDHCEICHWQICKKRKNWQPHIRINYLTMRIMKKLLTEQIILLYITMKKDHMADLSQTPLLLETSLSLISQRTSLKGMAVPKWMKLLVFLTFQVCGPNI